MSIRLWKGRVEDEGTRFVCQYLMTNPNCITLELLDCQISPLGCEFLQKALTPRSGAELQILKLDHNPIGSEGMQLLAKALALNNNILLVSLGYCGIDAEGA